MVRALSQIGFLVLSTSVFAADIQLESAQRAAAQLLAWKHQAESQFQETTSAAESTYVFQARLTTESGNAIPSVDRAAQSTLYLTPFQGSRIAVYVGTRWVTRRLTEISIPLSGLTAGSLYDVFVYDNAGVLAVALSTAWTSATARSQAISIFQGIYTLTATRGRRYVGTFRASSATTTEDTTSQRFVYNYYHRVKRPLIVTDTTDSWSYTSGTVRQTNANTANQVQFIQGISEDVAYGLSSNLITAAATVRLMDSVIGSKSTTAQSAQLRGGHARNTVVGQLRSSYMAYPAIGYTWLSWNERGLGGTVFYGDNGGDDRIESGMLAWVEM